MREFTRRAAILIVIASALAVTGCSKPGTGAAPATGAAGGTPAVNSGPPTASAIQSQMDKVESDPSLTPAQKQIMLNEGRHALTAPQPGGSPPK